MVRAKMKCVSKNQTEKGYEITLETGRRAFLGWLPGHRLTLPVEKSEDADKVVPGKIYFIDFELTETEPDVEEAPKLAKSPDPVNPPAIEPAPAPAPAPASAPVAEAPSA